MGRRLLATLRTLIAVPTFFLFTMGICAFVIVFSMFRPHHPTIDKVIHIWSRAFLTIAPISFDGTDTSHLDPNKQYVFVSNHLSNFDIPLLFLAVPHRIRYLAKAELYKIPLLAGAMRRIGIVKIDRGAGPGTHAAINDSVADAHPLVRLLKGIPAKLNLIPFNPWPGAPYECSSNNAIRRFSEIVMAAGYSSPVRTPRGQDIMAACGQLKSDSVRQRRRLPEVAAEPTPSRV